jgi:hypothetical protein
MVVKGGRRNCRGEVDSCGRPSTGVGRRSQQLWKGVDSIEVALLTVVGGGRRVVEGVYEGCGRVRTRGSRQTCVWQAMDNTPDHDALLEIHEMQAAKEPL